MRILLILILIGIAAEGVLFACVTVNANKPSNAVPSDAIIVLGARVWPNGSVSNVLEYRLKEAARGYGNGYGKYVIVCGAQGSDEPAPEAEVMKAYLIEAGVPEEAILTDAQSVNTKQNLVNAKALMEENGCETAIVVTSDYHMARALRLAKDVGIRATGIKAHPADDPGTRLKNTVRETASWVFYLLRK